LPWIWYDKHDIKWKGGEEAAILKLGGDGKNPVKKQSARTAELAAVDEVRGFIENSAGASPLSQSVRAGQNRG